MFYSLFTKECLGKRQANTPGIEAGKLFWNNSFKEPLDDNTLLRSLLFMSQLNLTRISRSSPRASFHFNPFLESIPFYF